MNKEQIKQALIAILIGACVAFFTTLFEALAEFLKSNSTDIIAGATSSFVYLIKRFPHA
jgi:hypothetical protein